MTGRRPVGLAEALDVRRPDDADGLGDLTRVLDQLPVLDRRALDRLAALRLDHRARDRVQAGALEVAEDVDRELLALAELLHERVDRRVAEEELELGTVRAPGRCGASRSPRAPSRAAGSAHRPGRRRATSCAGSRSRCPRRRGAPRTCRPSSGTPQARERASAGASASRDCASEHLVEVGQRDDQPDVVLGDQRGRAPGRSPGCRRAARGRNGRRGRAPARAGRRRWRSSSRPRARRRKRCRRAARRR